MNLILGGLLFMVVNEHLEKVSKTSKYSPRNIQ